MNIRVNTPAPVDGEALLDELEDFRRESMAGVYYAPFKINRDTGLSSLRWEVLRQRYY